VDKVKRNERLVAMTRILAGAPNKIFTLGHFCDMFGSAKSSISEDIDIVGDILEKYGLGTLRTVPGAAGGVMYLARTDETENCAFVQRLCEMVQDPSRILPGGYLYTLDILNDPNLTARMGEIIAGWYVGKNIDFVLTMETRGIPVALMTAHTLNVPLVIARRETRVTDGSVVTINYVSGSRRNLQTMSLPRKAVSPGQRALIVDDFMKGGGSAVGMCGLMKEFSVEVEGVAVLMATAEPKNKMIKDYKSLMVISNPEDGQSVKAWPSENIGVLEGV